MTEITTLLKAAGSGDPRAAEQVVELLYADLQRLARSRLRRSGELTLLDTNSLVHESYLKLLGSTGTAKFEDRAHFFAYAASSMRSVVVDYARSRLARKRGGDLKRVADIPEEVEGNLRLDEDMLALNDALEKLAAADERLAQVVEMRYFAGLSELEIAELLQRSERSIRRDWQKARMFLLSAMQDS